MLCALLPVSAAPALLTENPDSITYHTNPEDAVKAFRENMVARNGEFEEGIETAESMTTDELMDVFYAAFEETGSPLEGDYMRNHVHGYSGALMQMEYGTKYQYILSFQMEYSSSAEQEAAVTEAVNSLLESLGVFSLETDYEKVDAYGRIIWD